jgi:hypothetical protein
MMIAVSSLGCFVPGVTRRIIGMPAQDKQRPILCRFFDRQVMERQRGLRQRKRACGQSALQDDAPAKMAGLLEQ